MRKSTGDVRGYKGLHYLSPKKEHCLWIPKTDGGSRSEWCGEMLLSIPLSRQQSETDGRVRPVYRCETCGATKVRQVPKYVPLSDWLSWLNAEELGKNIMTFAWKGQKTTGPKVEAIGDAMRHTQDHPLRMTSYQYITGDLPDVRTFKPGDDVKHEMFGRGSVLDSEQTHLGYEVVTVHFAERESGNRVVRIMATHLSRQDAKERGGA